MKGRFLLLLMALLFCSGTLFAQKEITLINGLVYKYTELKVDSNWISFSFMAKNNKEKQKILSYEDVFTIRDGKKETIIYGLHQDTTEMPGMDEMRLFVAGQQSGRQAYKPAKHFVLGALFGFATGAATNSFLAASAAPPIYTLLTTLFPVNNSRFNNAADTEDAYRFGQKKQYKRMRSGTAIKSSIVGVVVGLVAGHYIAK